MFTIGVLAIQGAVSEHLDCIRKVGCLGKEVRNNKFENKNFDINLLLRLKIQLTLKE